jgi:hypothetical protein
VHRAAPPVRTESGIRRETSQATLKFDNYATQEFLWVETIGKRKEQN